MFALFRNRVFFSVGFDLALQSSCHAVNVALGIGRKGSFGNVVDEGVRLQKEGGGCGVLAVNGNQFHGIVIADCEDGCSKAGNGFGKSFIVFFVFHLVFLCSFRFHVLTISTYCVTNMKEL